MFRFSHGARLAGIGLLLSLGAYAQTAVTIGGERIAALRDAAPRPLLFEFVTNQGGLDTEITITNTSLNVPGSTAQQGTCSVQYFGPGAPAAQTTQIIVAGGQAIFTVRGGGAGVGAAPGFQGYAVASCTFAHSRGLAVVSNAPTGKRSVAWSYEAERIVTPRVETTPTTLLFSFSSHINNFDSRFVIANTSQDGLGTAPQDGTCVLNYYGTGPTTAQTTAVIPAGQVAAFTLSGGGNFGVASRPGFQGYVIAQCNFRGARGIVTSTDTLSQRVAFSHRAERLAAPRAGSPTHLLFQSVTNVGGRDTLVTIANTSQDTVGTTPTTGTCTLNYYGRTAAGPAPAPQTTGNILPGQQLVFTMTAGSFPNVAPTVSFDGYIIASCNFPGAVGLAITADVSFFRIASAERAQVITSPRTGETSNLLFPVVSGRGRRETTVRIANTSLDPFGSAPMNGTCMLNYVNPTGSPAPQTSLMVPAGQSLTFNLGQGNAAQGIAGTPTFRGYLAASCTFPMARGSAIMVEPRPTVFWQNDANRAITVWYMGGPAGNILLSWESLSESVPGWRLAATADFNGDGNPDLVWQNDTTRQVTVWYMGGPEGNTRTGWSWIQPANTPGWSVVAARDFNGDGKPDLVWQNDTTRQVTVWYMGGPEGNMVTGWNWIQATNIPGWKIVGAEDFSGDGRPDLLWQNDATRQVSVWYMEDNTRTGWEWIQQTSVPGWQLVGAGDFNGNGRPDLLWQNDATRQATVWYMTYTSAAGYGITGWNWISAAGVPGWRASAR
jgi:hypothetical protein